MMSTSATRADSIWKRRMMNQTRPSVRRGLPSTMSPGPMFPSTWPPPPLPLPPPLLVPVACWCACEGTGEGAGLAPSPPTACACAEGSCAPGATWMWREMRGEEVKCPGHVRETLDTKLAPLRRAN